MVVVDIILQSRHKYGYTVKEAGEHAALTNKVDKSDTTLKAIQQSSMEPKEKNKRMPGMKSIEAYP